MKRKKETKNRYLIKIVFLLIISGTIICIELEMLNKMNIENQKQYSTQKLITSQDEEENKLLEDNITSNNTQNLLEESNEENSFLENDNNEKNTLKDKGLNNENLNNKSLNNKNLNNENDGEVLQNYKGYSVCAKLEIPKIELVTYVIGNT